MATYAYLFCGAVVIFAQGPPPASTPPPVLTVCEALRNIHLYSGKEVIVIGESNWTFEGTFLHEKCEPDNRILIQGERWLSTIKLLQENVMDETKQPFPVDAAVIRNKLSEIKDYTTPSEKEVQYPETKPRARISLSGTWVAIYGEIESPSKLISPEGPTKLNPRNSPGNGYGANGSVPARIHVIKMMSLPPTEK